MTPRTIDARAAARRQLVRLVVRRIFGAYADGRSARSIVHGLNADGIPSPRGGAWAVSALVGDRKRGAGILNAEVYAGRLVWNRRQWLKDPETGLRRDCRHEMDSKPPSGRGSSAAG